MSNVKKEDRVEVQSVIDAYLRNKGNIRATAKELGIERSTVRAKLAKTGVMKKPLVGGTREGTEVEKRPIPPVGQVYRYILTSAQNNTHVHPELLANLEAFAKHYNAEIMVGTFTYNQNAYGNKAVKLGSMTTRDPATFAPLWYDPLALQYAQDKRIELANGLVWCGEYNALPTNQNPLESLEAYSGRQSAIFPQAKLAMRSIPTMQGEGTKLNFTTGCLTMKNYIQKRAGQIAEFHHIYGALIVEVDSDGHWWVRQLNLDVGTNSIQDLNVIVQDGEVVSTTATVEAITHGDLHGVQHDPQAVQTSLDMVDDLKPKYQFFHDIMAGDSVNPHLRKYKAYAEKFNVWLRGYHRLENELIDSATVLSYFDRDFSEIVIVDSNHDDVWIKRWLREADHRVDAPNAEIFLDIQAWLLYNVRNGVTEEQSRARTAKPKLVRDINVMEYALRKFGKYVSKAKFLSSDESFKTCGDRIENGMHGHLGPGGKPGSPEALAKMGRKAITAHTHTAGIFNGLYVAGALCTNRWDYAKGPTGWSNSEVVTYETGKRAVITFYAGKYRA